MSIWIKEQTKLLPAQSILVPYLQNVLQQRKLEAKGNENVNDNWGGKNKRQTPSLLEKIKRRRKILHTWQNQGQGQREQSGGFSVKQANKLLKKISIPERRRKIRDLLSWLRNPITSPHQESIPTGIQRKYLHLHPILGFIFFLK